MSVHVGKQTIDNSSENRLQNVSQSVGNAEHRETVFAYIQLKKLECLALVKSSTKCSLNIGP